MRLRRHWLSQQRHRQIGVAAGRIHQCPPQCIGIPLHPVALMRQAAAVRTWKPFSDEPEHLAANVSIDSFDEPGHRFLSTGALRQWPVASLTCAQALAAP